MVLSANETRQSLEQAIFEFITASISKRALVPSLCYENQFSFILKWELISITKISHLDSLWTRHWGELGNGLLDNLNQTRVETVLSAQNRLVRLADWSRRFYLNQLVTVVLRRLAARASRWHALRDHFRPTWLSSTLRPRSLAAVLMKSFSCFVNVGGKENAVEFWSALNSLRHKQMQINGSSQGKQLPRCWHSEF